MGDQLRTFILPGHSAGLPCGKCGELLANVTRTIKTPGFITRERLCPKCGQINTTAERVINTRERRRYFSEPGE